MSANCFEEAIIPAELLTRHETRRVIIERIGKVGWYPGQSLLLFAEPDPLVFAGDILLFRSRDAAAEPFRRGSVMVLASPDGRHAYLAGSVLLDIPCACEGDWAYRLVRIADEPIPLAIRPQVTPPTPGG